MEDASSRVSESSNTDLLQSMVAGNTEFAIELYKKLAAASDTTLFVSPASVHFALSVILAAAGGYTARQIARVLHCSLPMPEFHAANASLLRTLDQPHTIASPEFERKLSPSGRPLPVYQLSIANALWVDLTSELHSDFVRLAAESYRARIATLDLKSSESATRTINEWVATATKRRIPEILPSGLLDELASMVVTNAVYFKADWANTFEPAASQNERFYVSRQHPVDRLLMHQKDNFYYAENDECQVLDLRYKLGNLSMMVFLPKDIDGLHHLEKSISPEYIKRAAEELERYDVIVTLPRWSSASEFELGGALQRLGISDAFDRKVAEFPAIRAAEPVHLSSVLHKAFVAADEKGTEAAAATAGIMIEAACEPYEPPEPKVFRADHPFLVLIRHRSTGMVLFLGRVVDPRS